MTVTTRDIEILARTVYGEARGESDLGKLAVAWVVVNRARKYHVGLGEACLLSIHFSCWNNGRANDANQLKMMMANLSHPAFARCMLAALQAAHELVPDPTDGAAHYCAIGIEPDWAEGKTYETIGHHKFFRGIA